MKYSENSNYMKYMIHKMNQDIESAKQFLALCIKDFESGGNTAQRSDLLQRMGDLCFLEGDKSDALRYYRLSEKYYPNSLLVKYYFARFLAQNMKDSPAAIEKCDIIIEIAKNNPFEDSEDDFGSEKYISMANELKRELMTSIFTKN